MESAEKSDEISEIWRNSSIFNYSDVSHLFQSYSNDIGTNYCRNIRNIETVFGGKIRCRSLPQKNYRKVFRQDLVKKSKINKCKRSFLDKFE